MLIKSFDLNNLKENLSKDKLSIIKFSAEWCGPCKMLAPVLEEISNEISDVDIFEVDIDDDTKEELVKQYSVNVVPTIIFVKKGETVASFSGYKPKDEILKYINENK